MTSELFIGRATEPPPVLDGRQGEEDGRIDRTIGHRMSVQTLFQLYGHEYVEGYIRGWACEQADADGMVSS